VANILIIEDEVNVSSFIRKGLEEEGHHAEVAYDGMLGLQFAVNGDYEIIILDIVLPQINGIEVCKRFRAQKGLSVPIIMLSALGTTDDIVKGLETGADDYLIKPFRFSELVARINSLLRRKFNVNDGPFYKIADLEMDMNAKTVTRAGILISLTTKEFYLLAFFLRNPNRVLSRTRILENVWDYDTDVNTNIVDVYVNYLRNKIEKSFSSKLIHTVIGMGYILKEG
jgi:two-component system, OmpR family, copper resistance phosphate regulon response regulator CusR